MDLILGRILSATKVQIVSILSRKQGKNISPVSLYSVLKDKEKKIGQNLRSKIFTNGILSFYKISLECLNLAPSRLRSSNPILKKKIPVPVFGTTHANVQTTLI